jgi:hypothetical protein
MSNIEIQEVTQVIEIDDVHVTVITVGTVYGFTGSVNVPLQYGGIFNITTQNGLVISMGIYGM